MKIRALASLWIALLAAGCGKVPVVGKVLAGDDLPRRVSETRVVLIGKMVSLNERAVIGEEQEFVDGALSTRLVWYDVAEIEVIEILKGECDGSVVSAKFLSFDQTQFPPRDKADCRAFSSHDIWNPGIWLIDVDSHFEPRFTVWRGDYLPMARLDDVRKALGESARSSGDKNEL